MDTRTCRCKTCRTASWGTSFQFIRSLRTGSSTVMSPQTHAIRLEAQRRYRERKVALARTQHNGATSKPEAGPALGGNWASLVAAVKDAQRQPQVRAVVRILGVVEADVSDWLSLVKGPPEVQPHTVSAVSWPRAEEVESSPVPAERDVGVGLECWVLLDEGDEVAKPLWARQPHPKASQPKRLPEGRQQP